MFEVLLELIRRRIAGYLGSGDEELILGDSALREAGDLWLAGAGDDSRLAEAGKVLGELYCLRYFALPEGPDQIELARAVVVLHKLTHLPGAVPERLRIVLGDGADPLAQAAEGTRLLHQALTNVEPLFLDAATILLTAAVAGMAEGHPKLVSSLNNLCTVHQHRYLRSGDPGELDRAVETGERGVAVAKVGEPDRTMCLSNLGAAYLHRFARTAAAADRRRQGRGLI